MDKRAIAKHSLGTTSQIDWALVDALTEETIDYRDIPATDSSFWLGPVNHGAAKRPSMRKIR